MWRFYFYFYLILDRLMAFLPIYVYFITVCFLCSLVFYFASKGNPIYLKLFPFFLLSTMIAEYYGSYLSSINKSNIYLYNFFSIYEFCFYLLVLYFIIINKIVKRIILSLIVLYPVVAALNIFYFQGPKSFHTITYAIGCLTIVVFCVYYFFELFRLPKSVKLTRNPAFWICSGLLFFYCCGFPLYAFVNFWSKLKWVIKSFDSIVTILNIFLYSLFTIAFLCSRTRKYTLSSS